MIELPIQTWGVLLYVAGAFIYLIVQGVVRLIQGNVIYMRDRNGDPTAINFRLVKDFGNGTIEVNSPTGEKAVVFERAFSKSSLQLDAEL